MAKGGPGQGTPSRPPAHLHICCPAGSSSQSNPKQGTSLIKPETGYLLPAPATAQGQRSSARALPAMTSHSPVKSRDVTEGWGRGPPSPSPQGPACLQAPASEISVPFLQLPLGGDGEQNRPQPGCGRSPRRRVSGSQGDWRSSDNTALRYTVSFRVSRGIQTPLPTALTTDTPRHSSVTAAPRGSSSTLFQGWTGDSHTHTHPGGPRLLPRLFATEPCPTRTPLRGPVRFQSFWSLAPPQRAPDPGPHPDTGQCPLPSAFEKVHETARTQRFRAKGVRVHPTHQLPQGAALVSQAELVLPTHASAHLSLRLGVFKKLTASMDYGKAVRGFIPE
nr:proline-rich protein 36 [Oryctolagus cuniculus]